MGQLKEKLDAYNDALDKELETTSANELEAHRTAVGNVQSAWDNARQSLLEYDEAVKSAGQEKDPAADRLKRIQEVSAAETEAHLKRVEELNKEHVLWLKAHGASESEIAAAKEAGRREEDAIKDAAANRSITQTQEDIERRQQRQSDYDAVVAAETERVARADIALKQAKENKTKDTDLKRTQELDKKVADAQADLEATKALSDFVVEPGTYMPQDRRELNKELAAKAQAALDEAIREQNLFHAAAETDEKEIKEAQAEKTTAEAALARAQSAGTRNAARIAQETGEVKTARAVESQRERDQAAENILHTQAGRMNMTFEQLAIATGKTHVQIEAILQQILDHHLNLVTVLNQMAAQFVAQQGQLSQSRNLYGSG